MENIWHKIELEIKPYFANTNSGLKEKKWHEPQIDDLCKKFALW